MTSGVTLRNSADLLASVPYLLGFHPRDSVVVVALRDERVVFAARGDLPGPYPPGALAARIVAVLAKERATAAVVIGYGPATRVTSAVGVLVDALAGSPVHVIDAVRVEDGRYWSYLCADPLCCPPDGRPFDAAASPVAASAVYNGQVALPDRAALAARIAPMGGAAREAMRLATLHADDRLADLLAAATDGALVRPVVGGTSAGGRSRRLAGAAAVRAAAEMADAAVPSGDALASAVAAEAPDPDGDAVSLAAGAASQAVVPADLVAPGGERRSRSPTGGSDQPGPVRQARAAKALLVAGRAAVTNAFTRYRDGKRLTDDEIAWLTVLIAAYLPVRDLAWERTGDRDWHVALWTDVLQRVEPDLAAGPASLLAFAAWRNGEGALASVAVQRALEVAPEYALAHLMDEVLEQCLAPSAWKREPPRSKAKRRARRRRRSS